MPTEKVSEGGKTSLAKTGLMEMLGAKTLQVLAIKEALLFKNSKAFLMVAEAGLDVRLSGRLLNIGSAARFAVPDKIFGLTLILDFIDHCTALPSLTPPPAAVGSLTQRATLAGLITRKLSTNSADADKKDSQPKG